MPQHSLCYHACTHRGLPIACAPPACWQAPWLASLQEYVAIRDHHVVHERIGAACRPPLRPGTG